MQYADSVAVSGNSSTATNAPGAKVLALTEAQMPTLKSEILYDYMDADGLVSPRKCKASARNASGNGLMYLAEFLILLRKRGEIRQPNAVDMLRRALRGCQKGPGLFRRSPSNQDQESIDDIYGLCAVFSTFRLTGWGGALVDYGKNHLGYYDNTRPYCAKPFHDFKSLVKYVRETFRNWNGNALLWRQPQLLCAMYAAARRAPWWIYPFRLYTALVIATSCMVARKSNADARRVSWLLIQAMTPVSRICWQASKIWYRRLHRQYGPDGMNAVAALYYEQDHPFTRYWVD